ncbi:hypothetical protein ABZP36_016013 [Zizania latifolia]
MAETTHMLLFTFLCVLLVAILLKLKLRKTLNSNRINLPPGPWAVPVIGSMHCLLGSLPHHALRRLAGRYGPVMLLRVGHVRMLVLSSPEAAREVLKTHDAVFATRPLSPTMDIATYGGKGPALSPYGRRWKELRKICATELLSPRRVRSFRPIREAEAARLVRSVADASRTSPLVNVSEAVATMMNDVTMMTAWGARCPQQDEYLEELDKVVKLVAGFNLVDLFPDSRLARALSGGPLRAVQESHERIHRIMDAVIQDHLKAMDLRGDVADGDDDVGEAPRTRDDDLLYTLLRLQKDGGLGIALTTEIISATMFDMLAGGSETTTTTVTWAMSELMRSPDAMQRAQLEVRQAMEGKSTVTEPDIGGSLHYLQLVIKETLRLHPPFPLLLPRLATEPCKIMGYDVPRGTMAMVNVWAISRNERCWKNAEGFEPERFEGDDHGIDYNGTDFRFLPGGSGRRMCPGMMFAQHNIEIALASLLYHFDWELPGGENQQQLDMTESGGVTASRRTDLWLKATPFAATPGS